MSDPAADVGPLAALRAKIDALDHELVRLLARRMEVVSEISAWKLSHAAPIRDVPREHELLLDCRAHAEELGLAPDPVESILRLVLRASRAHQATLRKRAQRSTPRARARR